MLPKLCRDSHWGWGRITSSWSPLNLILFWIIYCSLLVGTPLVATQIYKLYIQKYTLLGMVGKCRWVMAVGAIYILEQNHK